MSFIFRKRKKDKELISEGVYAATYIPKKIDEFVRLVCLKDELSKSVVYRNRIVSWWVEHVKQEDTIIDAIAEKALFSWKIEKSNARHKKQSFPFPTFLEELRIELQYRGISEYHITAIMKSINGKKRKTKQTG